jgi:hypothetical protein
MSPAVLAEALSRSVLGRDPYIAAAIPALRAGSASVRAQIIDLVVNNIIARTISTQDEHEFCVQAEAMGYGGAYLGLPAEFKAGGAPFKTAVKGGTLPFMGPEVRFEGVQVKLLEPPTPSPVDQANACLDQVAMRRILYPDVDHLVRAILASSRFPSGQINRRLTGTESPDNASTFEGLILLRTAAEQVAGVRRSVVSVHNSAANEANRLTDFIYRYLRAGLASRNSAISSAYANIVLELCQWLRGVGVARPAGAVAEVSGPVLNDTDARAIFTHLSPASRVAVLRSLAFRGDAYVSSLANAIAQGRVEVDGFPIDTLLFAHVDRVYPARNDAHRVLFAYNVGLAGRNEGILVTPSGDPPAATPPATPTPPVPPADFLAAAGINADQWAQILQRSPETAAQMWTEYQRRPSTFSAVSRLILDAADVVLRGLHQSATDQLASQQAQYAHQQAMAQSAVQQAQASATAAQQLLGLTAPQPAPAVQTYVAPIVATPTTPVVPAQTQSSSMSTGTMAAIGGAVLVAGGGIAYVATRPKRKSNKKPRRTSRRGRKAA